MSASPLAGKRVMIVEDEYLIAVLVQELLTDLGCTVIGPFGRVQDALASAEIEAIDVALLDVNVAGELVFPVAYRLEQQGTPFLFVTGYGVAALPLDRPAWEACSKPFQTSQLVDCLLRQMQAV